MIRAIPDRFLSWNLTFFENDARVAQLRSSWWRKPSYLVIGGNTYQLYREKTFSGAFVMELDGKIVAEATKDRTYGGRFVVSYQGKDYRFHATWPYGWFILFLTSTFILYEGDRRVGKVVSKSALKKEIMIDLPDEIDLTGKVFITWLAIAMWKRGLFGSG